ncbi:hypothetical protein FOZ63_012934, partial [Perkinsus olseni]
MSSSSLLSSLSSSSAVCDDIWSDSLLPGIITILQKDKYPEVQEAAIHVFTSILQCFGHHDDNSATEAATEAATEHAEHDHHHRLLAVLHDGMQSYMRHLNNGVTRITFMRAITTLCTERRYNQQQQQQQQVGMYDDKKNKNDGDGDGDTVMMMSTKRIAPTTMPSSTAVVSNKLLSPEILDAMIVSLCRYLNASHDGGDDDDIHLLKQTAITTLQAITSY